MQVDKLLADIELRINKITSQVGGAGGGAAGAGKEAASLRQELHILNGYMIAIQKWSGNDTLAGAINKVQEINAMILRGYMLLEVFNDLYYASTLNPFLVAYAGVHAIGFAISVQNVIGQ